MVNKCLLLNDDLARELWEGIKCIALFVHDSRAVYVVDYKENFILDMKKEICLQYEKGRISRDKLQEKLDATYYRNGIWQLNQESVEPYLSSDDSCIVDVSDMRDFLFSPLKDKGLEISELLLNKDHLNILLAKLPMFYINFDKKLYRHTDFDRMHQDYAYDWDAKEGDFEDLVSNPNKYWIYNNVNYWKAIRGG